jgi:hypothetical protein
VKVGSSGIQRRPQDLPDYRDRLLRSAGPVRRDSPMVPADGGSHRPWFDEAVRQASLWWMAPEMYELARHAADGLPGLLGLGEVLPPDSTGLMVLGEERDGLRSLLWQVTDFVPNAKERRAGRGLRTMPLVAATDSLWEVSDWLLGETLNHREVGVGRQKDLTGRLMVASFLLLRDRIVEAEQASVPRGVRRRAEAAGLTSEVRLLTWRRRAEHGEAQQSVVDWSHRWWVSGHWRRQPCGPGRRERRLTYIAPHIKGPEDKPLDVRPTVNVWRR